MAENDPYVLTEAAIREPPQTWWGRLRYLGPGMILTANIIGAGELIATTALGAKAGFVTLWVIIVSCLIKVALQLEFGRHAIQSGETSMRSLNLLPGPKLGPGALVHLGVAGHPLSQAHPRRRNHGRRRPGAQHRLPGRRRSCLDGAWSP